MGLFLDRAADKFLIDPAGNSIAVIVLLFMISCVVFVIIDFLNEDITRVDKLPTWIIPALAIAGICVSIYLSFVELTKNQAFCGPIGDCNSVQQSKYAILFGILPIGILGIIGYSLILLAWLVNEFGPKTIRPYSKFITWLMAFLGILFSIYLTFLEPFVIGATCMWCISSALIMSFIFLTTTGGAKTLWSVDEGQSKS
jgi:uncharacterized membrane protein